MHNMIMTLLDWYYEADPMDADSQARQDLHSYMFNELAKLALNPYDFNELAKLALNPYDDDLRQQWREWKATQ